MTGRNVIASITLTIDGHTTGPGGAFDMSCIAPYGVSEEAREALVEMTNATTVLLGRRNYEGFGSWWPHVADDPAADPRDRLFARWLDTVDKVVFSSAPLRLQWENCRRAERDPVETVQEFRETGEGDIRVLASQSLIRQLLAADQLDRFEVTLAPEIVGGGNRLFGDTPSSARWTLAGVRPSASGAVLLTYDRTRGPEDSA